jgi:DNA adenine methylase
MYRYPPAPKVAPAQPVLKWAGGKQWLARAAQLLTPSGWRGRYYEAFLGGGSFFFALAPSRATLGDRNEELIAAYRTLSTDAAGVIRELRTYPYDKAFYYAMRSAAPVGQRASAARFIYLNRTCYNGLYRVNREGAFNTPFGRYTNPGICNPERLRRAATLLSRATLLATDFETLTARAKPGDLVYFDPPYITGHQNNGFLKYNSRLFTWADQERLATRALSLAERGVHVLVSNADYPSVIELYAGLRFTRIYRRTAIAGSSTARGATSESLFSSYPLLPHAPKES